MLRKASGIGVLLVALLAVPRPSEGGLIEFIWELSGPQMIGPGFGCTYDFHFQRRDCRSSGIFTFRREAKPRELLFFIGGEYTFSTGKNSDGVDYRFFRDHRLAFAPELSMESRRGSLEAVGIHHRAGISYELFFGPDFRRFDKFAFTVTPIEFVFRDKLAVGLKIRLYPNGFTPDEFGFGPRLDYDRPAEGAIGVSVNWIKRAT